MNPDTRRRIGNGIIIAEAVVILILVGFWVTLRWFV